MATSFPLFALLPLELQDHIWDLTLSIPDTLPAGAYHATLVRSVHSPSRHAKHLEEAEEPEDDVDPYTYPHAPRPYTAAQAVAHAVAHSRPPRHATASPGSTHIFLHRDGPELMSTPRDTLFASIAALQVTCRRAALAVQRGQCGRAAQRHAPEPGLLLRSSPWSSWSLSARRIDACSELVVLEHGWQRPCSRVAASAAASAGVYGSWAGQVQGLRALRHLGVVWPGPCADGGLFYNRESVGGLLAVWSELAALYVVVRPEYLGEAPWPPEAAAVDVQEYLAGCWREGPCAKMFITASREYFEVAVEDVAKAGHLWRAIELLSDARQQTWLWARHGRNQGVQRPWTRCRIMSWRNRPSNTARPSPSPRNTCD
ncbi:hypothetical protein BROUX41_004403 [Berkeleyomyces rouxiae]|uniref:uncharacterized protein n=1 Tax=Berkeleyomyces rouxiae TaxID=2035830 RepID=UPI003B761AB8